MKRTKLYFSTQPRETDSKEKVETSLSFIALEMMSESTGEVILTNSSVIEILT